MCYVIAAEYIHTTLIAALPPVCFVISFSVRINRRVRYVEYLSREIQLIREEGFGRTMELQGNARRYADKSAPVIVTAEDAGQLHICITNRVADAGELDPDQMFERFYRGDRAGSDTKSSGLGLAIVKCIVELHGGRILQRS